MGVGAYVTYTLNLWGPIARMTDAASRQALDIGKERLREFLETSETGRQAMAMSGQDLNSSRQHDGIGMDTLGSNGKKAKEEGLDDI
jgi:hypothetical protein